MTTRTFRFLVIAAFCIAAAGAARAAQLVVVSGGAPGLEPGTVVAADSSLTVPAGASVTLVTETGKTVTLTGPHSGPAVAKGEAGGDTGLISSLAGLLKGGGKESTSLGAMRSVGPKEPPQDPWVVDVGHTGVHCVPEGGAVTLWRAREGKARVLTLKNLGDKSRANAEWPAGAETMAWPADVGLADGARYLAGFKGSRATKKLTLRLVPKGLANDARRAAWMAANGCEPQARRLLARLR